VEGSLTEEQVKDDRIVRPDLNEVIGDEGRNVLLDGPLERASPELRIESVFCNLVQGPVRQVQHGRAPRKSNPTEELLNLQPGDLLDGLQVERPKRDDPVDSIDELRPEVILYGASVNLTLAGVRLRLEADGTRGLLGPQVRRHHDDRLRKVDGTAERVGQMPLVQHLKEQVVDRRVRLFDLV